MNLIKVFIAELLGLFAVVWFLNIATCINDT